MYTCVSRARCDRTRGHGFKLKEVTFRLPDMRKTFFYDEGGETQDQVARRGGRCPIPGHVQGQAGRGSGQPHLVEDAPAHCRGLGLDGLSRSLPTQAVLCFYAHIPEGDLAVARLWRRRDPRPGNTIAAPPGARPPTGSPLAGGAQHPRPAGRCWAGRERRGGAHLSGVRLFPFSFTSRSSSEESTGEVVLASRSSCSCWARYWAGFCLASLAQCSSSRCSRGRLACKSVAHVKRAACRQFQLRWGRQIRNQRGACSEMNLWQESSVRSAVVSCLKAGSLLTGSGRGCGKHARKDGSLLKMPWESQVWVPPL